jgi:endonuclease I
LRDHRTGPISAATLVLIITLAGTVSAGGTWNDVTLSDTTLTFGTVSAGVAESLSITLTNSLDVPVEITGLRFSEDAFTAACVPEPVPPGGSRDIMIGFESDQNLDLVDFLLVELDRGYRPLVCRVSAEVHYPGTYYASTRNEWGEELKGTLTGLIDGHNSLGYTAARDEMYGNVDNHDGWVECVYTGRQAYFSTRQGANENNFNCEHTWPQSFSDQHEPMRSDLFHLYPSDVTANSKRSNLDFGVVTSVSWSSGGSRLGTDATGQTVFEPRDCHKGNVARTHFYYAIRYDGNYNEYVDPVKMESHLRAWHLSDPVDSLELLRNEDIYALQLNRNPFIDHPALVERISSFFGTALYEPAPRIVVGPVSADMGLADVNTEIDCYLAVINTGGDTLHVSSIVSSDPDFTIGSPVLELPPEASTYVKVTYSGSSVEGCDSTSVTVNSDDGDQPSVEVPVVVTVAELAGMDGSGGVPLVVSLRPNRPDPFSRVTVIDFELGYDAEVSLEVFSVDGRLVDRPLEDRWMAAGTHSVTVSGESLSPGIYFYRLAVGGRVLGGRMTLVGTR